VFSVFNQQPRPQQPQQQRPVFSVFNQPRPQLIQGAQPQPQPQPRPPQLSPRPQQLQPRPPQLSPRPQQLQPRPPQLQQRPQPQQAASGSGARPVQQVSFGTQVANPVFARFGVPQPFSPFGRPPQQQQQQGQFRPPQAINFFGSQN